MDKTELLHAIQAAHAPIETAVSALDDAALLLSAPGMPGWTRKDVLAHLEWWNDHSVNVIAGVRTGVDPYPDGDEPWDTNAWNARILDENAGRSTADVRGGEAASFARLVAAVKGATDEELFSPHPQPWLDGTVAGMVEDDSTRHYPEHVPHLG